MVEEGHNQPDFPPKRIRFEEIKAEDDEDGISRLSDSLLVEILSRLPTTKCAVKTGALSKRWKHVWTLVPVLIFIHHDDPSADFVSYVDKTLNQRGQLNLKNLTLHCTYNGRFEPQVRNWIRYAIHCNVEELNIMLWDPERRIGLRLDQSFFMNSYFTNLNLKICQFKPARAISWKKLLRLHVLSVKLDEDLIENILSGSPVLETLVLKQCNGYTQLNITSKSVKKLVLDGYMFDSDVIEINAPTILSLAIKAHLYMRKLLLINVSSLVEAELNYMQLGFLRNITKEAEEEMLKGFLLSLRHVKKLKIGTHCFKVLSCLEAKGFTVPSNFKVCDFGCYF